MDKWINVEDRIPEFTKSSLLGNRQDFAYIGWNGYEQVALDEYPGYWPDEVTHWRTLPEPPEKEGIDG